MHGFEQQKHRAASAAEVLIVGAGPTGLVLAIWLTRLGVRVRIVEKLAAPETTSRAIGVQARTLEFYRQIDLAEAAIEKGRIAPAMNLWVRGHRAARLPILDMGADISPFPFALVLSQDEHEHLLIEHLAGLDVAIERQTELIAFEEGADGVRARLRRPDGAEEVCETPWIVGCDGARSNVRETLKIGFAGGTYAHRFYVADVQAGGPALNGEVNVALDETDFVAIFPLKGEGRARVIGTVRDDSAEEKSGITWNDVNKSVIEGLRMKIERVNWFSTYRVHHRVASCFRRGRAFLAGDSAHIHTPVGGQGMNTGIGDAINLAWKLAAVLRGRAAVAILDSYEPERIAFARRLVDTTDRVFTGVTSERVMQRWGRLYAVPWLVPLVFRLAPVRHFMFQTLSQAVVNYRGSFLSEGQAGDVHGGDRLPWVKPRSDESEDNFTPLTSMDWQVHVYGEAADEIKAVCQQRKLPLHVFPWRPETGRAGFQRDAVYLVRPDGYVAMADDGASPAALTSYFASRKFSESLLRA